MLPGPLHRRLAWGPLSPAESTPKAVPEPPPYGRAEPKHFSGHRTHPSYAPFPSDLSSRGRGRIPSGQITQRSARPHPPYTRHSFFLLRRSWRAPGRAGRRRSPDTGLGQPRAGEAAAAAASATEAATTPAASRSWRLFRGKAAEPRGWSGKEGRGASDATTRPGELREDGSATDSSGCARRHRGSRNRNRTGARQSMRNSACTCSVRGAASPGRSFREGAWRKSTFQVFSRPIRWLLSSAFTIRLQIPI